MSKAEDWSTNSENRITITQRIMSKISLRVREDHFNLFLKILKPKRDDKILDVGIRGDETLSDSNFFEKRYPHPKNLTAVSIEDCQDLFREKYPQIKFVRIKQDKPLPFKEKFFDLVVSWATLEHVGEAREQKFFLKELFRVGKRVFITTPDRHCFYEPHSGFLFLHWLPDKYFRSICKFVGKIFWADKKNLNPLIKKDIDKILPNRKNVKILSYKILDFIPSHLMIIKEK